MTVAAWSAVSLQIQNVDTNSGTLEVFMENDEAVGGFQFEISGISITSATGPAGYFLSTSPTTVLGFSLTGATIPAGSGVLSLVSFSGYTGDDICFGIDTGSSGTTAISNSSGGYIAASWGECYSTNIYGCTDLDACNYNGDANIDDGSCESALENFDCDGNCTENIDCNGECGGTAIEDECGICNGEGAIFECGCSNIAVDACDCENNILLIVMENVVVLQ